MSTTDTGMNHRLQAAVLEEPPSTYGDADQIVASLVAAAKNDEEWAWEQLITRCEPLVTSIARRYRLSPTDTADVSQMVWLKLLTHLTELREPRALMGWIRIVTRNVCLEMVTSQRRTTPLDPQMSENSLYWLLDGQCGAVPNDMTCAEERMQLHECQMAIRQGLAELTPAQRNLLLLLAVDPPVSYKQISCELGISIGSIGPSRARFLKKLGDTDAVQRLVGTPTTAANVLTAA
jgi:RNA polymerase sigma factor (sigma-70 family)